MKTFLTSLLCCFVAVTSIAQTTSTVNIIFRGINKSTNNYQVMIDANSYYSNTNIGNTANYTITVPNVPVGAHTLKLYRLKNNDPVYNGKTQNTFVYSKNFEVSQGYDMTIAITAAGRVQFSEQFAPSYDNSPVVSTPMTDYQFNQLIQSVRARGSQALRSGAVRDAFDNTANYFSTAQVRQLLVLVTSESGRFDLAKLSFDNVTDPVNFYLLVDVFNSSAYRNQFNNYVASLNSSQSGNTVRIPMADSDFRQIMRNVQNEWLQGMKIEIERNAFVNTGNYFSTAQIRQLIALISAEGDRLDLVKQSYNRVTDPLNYSQLGDLFNSSSYRNEFIAFAGNAGVSTGTTVRTAMTDYQFNILFNNINNQWSQSLKADTERDAFLNTANYFATAQIRQLLSLINSESDRLALAKISYRSVTDPTNFPQLADMFTINSNRVEFNNYVLAQGGQVVNTSARVAMSDADFSNLVFSVRSNLLQILKMSAERDIFNNPNYFFTVSQAKQLISLINSESNRLELAKLSYKTLTDPANFTQLYELFKIQASKDELATYVKNNQVL